MRGSRWVEIVANLIRLHIEDPGLDNNDTQIDRQRQVIGLILFVIFIGIPAAFLLLWIYFPDFAAKLFR